MTAKVSHLWLNRRKATIVVDRDEGLVNPSIDLLPPDMRYALRRWLNGDQK